MAGSGTAFETLPPGGAVTNGDGTVFERDVREFVASGNTPAEALALLRQVIPNIDVHPGGVLRMAGLTAVERIGAGTDPRYRFRAEYAPPGSSLTGGGQPADRTGLTFRAYSTEFVPMTLEAPTFTAVPIWFEDEPGGTRTVKGVEWKSVSIKVAMSAIKLSVEVNLSVWGINEVAIVAGQMLKVHTFGGRKWQFLGARQSFGGFRADENKITYSWLSEPGIPVEYFAAYNARQGQIGNGGYPIPALAPFERWRVRWAEDSQTCPFAPGLPQISIDSYLRPDIFAEPALVESAGFDTLPGAPIQ